MARVATGLNSLKYINWDEVQEILGEHPEASRSIVELMEKMKREASEKAGENVLFALALKYCFDNDLDDDEAMTLAANELRKILRKRERKKKMQRLYG